MKSSPLQNVEPSYRFRSVIRPAFYSFCNIDIDTSMKATTLPCSVLCLHIMYLGQNVEYLLDNIYAYVVIALHRLSPSSICCE